MYEDIAIGRRESALPPPVQTGGTPLSLHTADFPNIPLPIRKMKIESPVCQLLNISFFTGSNKQQSAGNGVTLKSHFRLKGRSIERE